MCWLTAQTNRHLFKRFMEINLSNSPVRIRRKADKRLHVEKGFFCGEQKYNSNYIIRIQ